MRICILGSSHVAALKLAYSEDKISGIWPESVSVTYFAARGNGINQIQQLGNKLTPGANDELRAQIKHTSGGLEDVLLEDFDLFVLAGLFRVPDLDHRYTRAFRDSFLTGIKLYSSASNILNMIRATSNAPVLITPNPLSANPKSDYPQGFEAIDYSARIELVQTTFTDRSAVVVGQPEETLSSPLRTRLEYCGSAPRLDVGGPAVTGGIQPRGDYFHMNAAFGRMQMRDLLDSAQKAIKGVAHRV